MSVSERELEYLRRNQKEYQNLFGKLRAVSSVPIYQVSDETDKAELKNVVRTIVKQKGE